MTFDHEAIDLGGVACSVPDRHTESGSGFMDAAVVADDLESVGLQVLDPLTSRNKPWPRMAESTAAAGQPHDVKVNNPRL
ncbi:MAG: hypothetical protein WD448_11100 [Woeseia sp.]